MAHSMSVSLKTRMVPQS